MGLKRAEPVSNYGRLADFKRSQHNFNFRCTKKEKTRVFLFFKLYKTVFIILKSEKILNSTALDSVTADENPDHRLMENEQLFQGDIVGIRSVEDLKAATTNTKLLWPNGQIPYVLSTSFSQSISIIPVSLESA